MEAFVDGEDGCSHGKVMAEVSIDIWEGGVFGTKLPEMACCSGFCCGLVLFTCLLCAAVRGEVL